MTTPRVYNAFDLPPKVVLSCQDLSRTQQHFKDECDLPKIMARAMSTGEAPPTRPTFYGDFSSLGDFQTLHDKLNRAQNEFMSLPANVRERFYNNPANLIDFMFNPQNRQEAIALGLVEAPKSVVTVTPLDVTVTTDTNNTTEKE